MNERKGRIQNKTYGHFSAQIMFRGWGSEFYDVPASALFYYGILGELAPPLNAASDVSQAVSMGLWKYALAEMVVQCLIT